MEDTSTQNGHSKTKKTIEEKLLEKQEQIAARLSLIAAKRKAERRESEARLDRLIGAVCRADENMREPIKAVLAKRVKTPHERELLKIHGWL